MKAPIVAVMALSLAGCASMVARTIGSFGDTQIVGDQYPKYPVRSSEVDQYRTDLAVLNEQVVQDDKGTYYIELDGQGVHMIGFKNGDMDVLKGLLTSSIGLMEPLYTYEESGDLVLSRSTTEDRYYFLSNEVGLNLLPLEITFRYYDMVKQIGRDNANKILNGSGFDGAMQAFSGNTGIYGQNYYDRVTQEVTQQFDYLVQNPGSAVYGQNFESSVIEAETRRREEEFMRTSTDPRAKYYKPSSEPAINENLKFQTAAGMMAGFYDVYFVPLEFYRTATKGISFNVASGCRYKNFEQMKKDFEVMQNLTDIPYVSTISALVKANNPEEQQRARDMFTTALRLQDGRQKQSQKACLTGLKALDVNGVIESSRLK